MSGSIEGLVVDLSVNSAKLKSGLDEAHGWLHSFGEKLEGIDKKLHAISQNEGFQISKEVVEGLGEFVQKGAEAAAQMGILAHSAQVPVEAFSKLSYAAKLSGVSTEDLAGVFNKLNKNVGLAGAGVPAQVALFDSLGIAIKDSAGKVKPSATLFSELATKFAGMEEGASKATLEMEVFGKTGTSLDAMLSNGAEGLAAFGAEADRFGLTIGPAAAEAAHEFEQSLTKLQLAGNAVGTRVAANLSPALTDLTNQLLHSQAGADLLKGAAEVLTVAIKLAASGAIFAVAMFASFGDLIAEVAEKLVALSHGDLKEVARANDEYAAKLKANGETMRAALTTIWDGPSDAAKKAHEEMEQSAKASSDKIQAAFEAQKKAITESDAAFKEISKTLRAWEEKVAASGKSPLEALEASLNKGQIAEQLSKIGAKAEVMRFGLEQAGKALIAMAALKLDQKINFDVSRSDAATDFNVGQKSTAYSNIGTSLESQGLTKGFASFDAAITAYAVDVHNAAILSGEAERAKANNNTFLADTFTLLADTAKRGAEQSLKAADAFAASKERLIAADKLQFEVSRQATSTAETVRQRSTVFQNVGRSGDEVRSQQEAGFSSFEDALAKFAAATNKAAEDTALATKAYAAGDILGGQAMTIFADQAKLAAEKASKAGDAFQAGAEAAHQASQKMMEIAEGVLAKVAGKMGQAGEVISAGISGFKSGGFMGAIVAVIVDVATKLTGFTKMMDSINAFFGRWIAKVSEATAPLFDAIISICEDIGTLIETITDVTHSFEIIGLVMRTLGLIIDTVELSFLYIGKYILQAFGSHDAKLDAMVAKLEADVKRGYDPVQKAADKTAASLQALNEQLINIPQGFKVAAARFKSDSGAGGAAPSNSSSGGPSTSDRYGSAQYQTGNGLAKNDGTWTKNDGSPWGSTVSQGQYSESTRPSADAAAAAAAAAAQAQADQDQRDQQAARDAQYGDDGRGSSSGAATAAGGGNSGIHSVGSPTAPAAAGDVFNFYIDSLILQGVTDVQSLYKKITELANTHRALKTRNAF